MIKELKTQQEKDERAKKCLEDINKILKKHNCSLEPVGTINNQGIQLGLNITAK